MLSLPPDVKERLHQHLHGEVEVDRSVFNANYVKSDTGHIEEAYKRFLEHSKTEECIEFMQG